MAPENGDSGEKAAEPSYTIDELAARSGVPSRTIRFYQSAGALPRPEIRGRVAYYGPAHFERLELVADLQDRGLRIKAICNLLGQLERGELDIAEWLGFDTEIAAPWAEDAPKVVNETGLAELIGGRRPGLLARLVRVDLIERRGEAFFIRSPGLLQQALQLEAAGIDLETAAGGLDIIRKHAARAASDLAKYFFKQAAKGFGRGAGAGDLARAFRAVRSTSRDTLQLLFGQEMERVLRDISKSGKTTSITRGRQKSS